MAVLQHFSNKKSPLQLLEYIEGITKTKHAEIVSGVNCTPDAKSAYLEMKMNYEHYAGEDFYTKGDETGKTHLRMHHYVLSFKGQEVSAEKAERIAREWTEKVFGKDYQALIAIHTDTKNIHAHIAVNAISLNGKRWHDNKKTREHCKAVINKICEGYHLNVIKNPKRKNNSYAEWLARQSGNSWKEKLCDDIDSAVLMDHVHSIDDFVFEMTRRGYTVKRGKYLSIKPTADEKARFVRTLRLGDGYGLEELLHRIENKNIEMSLDKVISYTGEQREYALFVRAIQIRTYRDVSHNDNEMWKRCVLGFETLGYMTRNNIHSKEAMAEKVNEAAAKVDKAADRCNELREKIAEYEEIVERGGEYIGLYEAKPHNQWLARDFAILKNYPACYKYGLMERSEIEEYARELDTLKRQLKTAEEEYDSAKAERNKLSSYYTTIIRSTENDYDTMMKNARKELEDHEKKVELEKAEARRRNGPTELDPKKDKAFIDAVEGIGEWSEKVHRKKAEKDRIASQKNSYYYDGR